MIVIDMGESTAILDSCFHLNFLLKSGRLASPLRIAHPLERFRAFTALLRAPASCRSRVSAVPRVPALLVPCTPFSCGSQLPPVSCDVIEREQSKENDFEEYGGEYCLVCGSKLVRALF